MLACVCLCVVHACACLCVFVSAKLGHKGSLKEGGRKQEQDKVMARSNRCGRNSVSH